MFRNFWKEFKSGRRLSTNKIAALNSKLLGPPLPAGLDFFIIAIPLVIALVYLPSLYREFKVKDDQLLGGDGKTQTLAPSSLDQLFKLLPLDAAKQEQLKAILK